GRWLRHTGGAPGGHEGPRAPGVGVGGEPWDDGVPGLVVRDAPPLAWIEQQTPDAAEEDLVLRLSEVRHRHLAAVVPRGDQRRLVRQVREVRAAQPGRAP